MQLEKGGISPLLLAVHEDAAESFEICKLLIDAGAEVDHADDEGKTPFFVAAETGNLDMLQFLLLEHGANPNAPMGTWSVSSHERADTPTPTHPPTEKYVVYSVIWWGGCFCVLGGGWVWLSHRTHTHVTLRREPNHH